MICVICRVCIHFSVEKRKDIFSLEEHGDPLTRESGLNLQIR